MGTMLTLLIYKLLQKVILKNMTKMTTKELWCWTNDDERRGGKKGKKNRNNLHRKNILIAFIDLGGVILCILTRFLP